MLWAKNKQTGFTIVELLIVVVVIAILASITVVAYTGMQDRALNASRISSAQSAYKLLSMYQAEQGTYPVLPTHPVTNSLRASCIGNNWPTMQGQPVCWNIYTDDGEVTSSTYSVVESVNEALKKYGSLPNYPQQYVASGTQASTGRFMNLNALIFVERLNASDPTYPLGFSIAYVLKGPADTTDCGMTGAVKQQFSGAEFANATRCVVPLPAPING